MKGRREGKLRKTSNVAKELAAKITAACLIVVFFSAPRASRVGGGAGEYRQDGKIGLQAPGRGAWRLAVKRKEWAVLHLAPPAILLLRISAGFSAFVALRPSRLFRSKGRELSRTFLIMGRAPRRKG